MPASAIDTACVNTIKGLAMDAVQKANSGHPGMPMGCADMAYVLWTRFLKHDPSDPQWLDRDRFILSAGHGSMLLYSLLHLTGYDLPLEELRNFRQWGSKTPGHPEVGHTVGVETTTGPLGQGFANGVGMALAERVLRTRFGEDLVDHYTYAIVSDGDIMEGIASEAASLAGHLKLGKLVYLYDDNSITLDGSTDISFTEDRAARFAAMGWHVQTIDGHDHDAIAAAISEARSVLDMPSIVCCRTHIGHGSPNKQDSSSSHGAPLGEEEIVLTKQGLGMDPSQHFHISDEVRAHFVKSSALHQVTRMEWEHRLNESDVGEEFVNWFTPIDVDAVDWPEFEAGGSLATRKASHKALNAAAAVIPNLLGGSADLAGSNGSLISGEAFISGENFSARNLTFGVREHAMASMCNGMALHGGLLPYCATFLVFHDYMRPAVRLTSLMEQQVVYIYTHDSVFVGEDGPTHQPIEQLMALRLIPGLVDLRPADAAETVEAWKVALSRHNAPVALSLTRQGLPVFDRGECGSASGLAKGAYVMKDAENAQVVLIGTGSEVAVAMEAQAVLAEEGISARVVSMPSWKLFEEQDSAYQVEVLPAGVPRVSVEAGRTFGWERWTQGGASIGIDRFGASAPGAEVADKLGVNVSAVVEAAKALL
ncbi:MAG: transketolase [Myxococcota bacterium]|nr:transketolase [Myxococcota bacterium]